MVHSVLKMFHPVALISLCRKRKITFRPDHSHTKTLTQDHSRKITLPANALCYGGAVSGATTNPLSGNHLKETNLKSRGISTKLSFPEMDSLTRLLYFDDMWQLQTQATVVDLLQDEERVAIILDQTIFYPQGGGQPSDKGWICGKAEQRFRVEDVRIKNGVVHHYGTFETSPTFEGGQEVKLLVDEQRRELNSRLHTAGHLLDICMQNVGLKELEPGKGYHFPDGPFVEYKGVIPAKEIELKRIALEEEANRLVAAGGPVCALVATYKQAEELCGGNLPQYIAQDTNPRIVIIGSSFGCPCGGTHVKDISSIGNLKVTQIRVKKGITKVIYNITR